MGQLPDVFLSVGLTQLSAFLPFVLRGFLVSHSVSVFQPQRYRFSPLSLGRGVGGGGKCISPIFIFSLCVTLSLCVFDSVLAARHCIDLGLRTLYLELLLPPPLPQSPLKSLPLPQKNRFFSAATATATISPQTTATSTATATNPPQIAATSMPCLLSLPDPLQSGL
jgi:hypothetical protein